MLLHNRPVVITLVVALLAPALIAAEPEGIQPPANAPVPQGPGLAARYPGDEGLETDPAVLFLEDFETGSPQEIGERWGQIYRPENAGLSDDIHARSPGLKSIHIKDNGHLFTHTRGVDTFFARFYVKFHPKTGYIHHFVHIVADRTPTPWPKGGAGETPPGDAKFSTGIEPTGRWGKFPPPGVWNFYTYWHEMETKWGSVYNGIQEPIEPGRWYCVEAMLKANSTPEAHDGVQAFWVDGKLYGYFDGFRWRTTDKLKINSFWLLYYNTEQPAQHNNDPTPESRVMEVWFDDIVLATEYIGPVQGAPKAGKKKAAPSRSALLTAGLLIAEPTKTAFKADFASGPSGFKEGRVATHDGAAVYEFGSKGASNWNTFSVDVTDATTVRFRIKPTADVSDLQVLIWSDKANDNCRIRLGAVRKDQWRTVEFRAIEARVGWDMKGKSLEGDVLSNVKIAPDGPADARYLLSDFEVRE